MPQNGIEFRSSFHTTQFNKKTSAKMTRCYHKL
jgi:hypothetical protein